MEALASPNVVRCQTLLAVHKASTTPRTLDPNPEPRILRRRGRRETASPASLRPITYKDTRYMLGEVRSVVQYAQDLDVQLLS